MWISFFSTSQQTFPKGTLCFLQEVLGSHLAGIPARQPAKDAPLYSHALARAKVNAQAVKVALYGLLVSAPLSHVLVGQLQKAFAGKTGRAARLGQIFASNLIVTPIQTFGEFLPFPFPLERGAAGGFFVIGGSDGAALFSLAEPCRLICSSLPRFVVGYPWRQVVE